MSSKNNPVNQTSALSIYKINQRLKNIEAGITKILKQQNASKHRRKSGKMVSSITRLGLDKEADQLFSQQKTYQEISNILSHIAGQKISKSSVARYFKAVDRDNC